MSTDTTELLAHLREHYANTPAPKPSPALAVRMDAGAVGVAAVITGTPADELAAHLKVQDVRPSFLERARARTRYVAAGVAAAFVATGGLAAAGVLPHPLQREVSSIASDLGIDLPSPVDASPSDQGPGSPSHSPNASSVDGSLTTGDTPTAPSTVPPITAPPIAAPDGQGVETTPTTVPSPSPLGTGPVTDGLPPIALPPVTTPEIDLPLEGVDPLPVIGLPPITVPQLPIDLDSLLPGFR